MEFTNIILERKAVRKYDENTKISHEEMTRMLDEAARAPSSVNMQPWRVAVVESDEGKAILKPLIRFNQKQNDTSSAMLVIFGDMNCYDQAETIYDQAVAAGLMPLEIRNQQLSVIVPHYQSFSKKKMNDVVKIDASLFAMQFMLVARNHGYETCPIGGFEEDQIANALGYDPERYVPVLIISIGKALETGYESVRLPAESFTTWK